MEGKEKRNIKEKGMEKQRGITKERVQGDARKVKEGKNADRSQREKETQPAENYHGSQIPRAYSGAGIVLTAFHAVFKLRKKNIYIYLYTHTHTLDI